MLHHSPHMRMCSLASPRQAKAIERGLFWLDRSYGNISADVCRRLGGHLRVFWICTGTAGCSGPHHNVVPGGLGAIFGRAKFGTAQFCQIMLWYLRVLAIFHW